MAGLWVSHNHRQVKDNNMSEWDDFRDTIGNTSIEDYRKSETMSEEKYKHKEGDRIYFDLDGKIKGFGIIHGATTDDLPEIGRSWIVELEPPYSIDSKIYPFTCIAVFECQIKEPPSENPLQSA